MISLSIHFSCNTDLCLQPFSFFGAYFEFSFSFPCFVWFPKQVESPEDSKRANILLDENLRPLLADLGFGRTGNLMENQPVVSVKGIGLASTLICMEPEVMSELLTGVVPYTDTG